MKDTPRTVMFNTFAIEGMTLRDYFAAKVMQGFVQGLVEIEKNNNQETSKAIAFMSYKFADEMMEARNATI